MIRPQNSKALLQLCEAGIIPENCAKWSLVSEASGTVKIISEVFVTEDQMQKIADVLGANRDEIRQFENVTIQKAAQSMKILTKDATGGASMLEQFAIKDELVSQYRRYDFPGPLDHQKRLAIKAQIDTVDERILELLGSGVTA